MTATNGQGSGPALQQPASRPRTFAKFLALAAFAAFLFAGFTALGTWQLYRLQWKRALISRVDRRVHAAPVAAPGPRLWPSITADADEYLRVRVTGLFLYRRSTLVLAVTELGRGYWVMTPLKRPDGTIIMVNRGFISEQAASQARGRAQPPSSQAPATVSGLLRITEPGGGFLHHNDPADHRWYSRDVQAIAAAHGLAHVAPYFIDADAASAAANDKPENLYHPVGGLTVVHFRNAHLSYALTWYTLALMSAAAFVWVLRDARRRRPDGAGEADRVE